ncbi:MAG: hypothetical protein AAF799_03020 [Myxococcota bacterium]
MPGLIVGSLALFALGACPGDDGGEETTAAASTGVDTPATTTGNTSEATPGSSSGGGEGETSTGAAEGSSSDGADGSSSGGGPLCDPPVVGEWNACINEAGNIDNTMCNWMGTPDNMGFLTCLSSADIKGGNICTISGCEDTCDCFNPPTTGTAEVICAPILEGGDNACGLDCSAGQTCPDGMQCGNGLCFWPPAR